MSAESYLRFLKDEIHSVVLATVGEDGHPETRIINMMLLEGTTLYFLTSSSKSLYRTLLDRPHVAITGVTAAGDSLSKQSVSLVSQAQCIGQEKLEEILLENPYMKEIMTFQYPSETDKKTVQIFKLEHGTGQFYDLTVKPAKIEKFDW